MPEVVSRPDSGPAVPLEPAGGLDGFEVLEQVANLPISTWRYEWEAPHVRHLGPMAQDWASAFGLGVNDTTIAAVDANGVTLLSVQALYRLIRELRQEVTDLHQQVSALVRR